MTTPTIGGANVTFDDEFPNAKHHEQHNVDGDEVLHFDDTPMLCCMCKTPCRWVSIIFEVTVCSRKCLGEFWNEYSIASAAVTEVSEDDFDFLIDTIENPPEPTQFVRDLMKKYPREKREGGAE